MTPRFRAIGCGLAFALSVSANRPAAAQELRGRLVGEVRDNTGAVLPGVTVTASGPALMQPQTSTTTGEGTYGFPALPSGVYTLTFEMNGFQALKREGIRVLLNTTLTINAQLGLAGREEYMTVTGESPAVDVKTTSIGTSFTKELLTDLPNARDVWAAMAQAPGFQMTGYDVGGSHTGTQTGYLTYGVGDQNKTLLEGINVTESTNANAGYFDFGSFEEFQLGGAGNMGEQAGPGALLNITAKSGGDAFHGTVYADYEGDSTISDNVPDAFRASAGTDANGFKAPTGGLARGNPITKQYDLNFGVGGPIVKGKLWFYVGYRLNNQYKTILGLDDEAQSKLPNYSAKLNYQINPRNQLIFYANQRTKLQNPRELSLARPAESAWYQASKNRPIKLEWTSVLSNSLFLDLQGAALDVRADEEALGLLASVELAAGDARGALARAESVLAGQPAAVRALEVAAIARAQAGDRTGARRAFEGLRAAAPDDPDAAVNFGIFELEGGDAVAAGRLFREAALMAPNDPRGYEGLRQAALRTGHEGWRRQAEVGLARLARAGPR